MTQFQKKLWIGLGIMALLTPLGIYLPEKFGAGDAWGEWGTDTLKEMLGYVPAGLEKLSRLWSAPLPDYTTGAEGASTAVQYVTYIASGLIGIAIAGLVFLVIKKTVLKDLRNGQR
ncbi:MAG: cobalamin biosynthesis protein [Nitrospirae bacterium]|nr:cobalamin biosynthesis protein [Nitrospirota bacterium]